MKQLRIKQLSTSVANQIAAGEVIERPASVVKELLENALDAGADVIHIEIGFGGLNQIKISDNGVGIVAEDLQLAISPHATSKITKLNDLYAITTMGFRGEALASIASVSKLFLSSKPSDQEFAMMLRFEEGVPHLSPCARTQGTTVEVRDLFFNAPVRKKFLKTPRSEYQSIEMVVKRFAFSAPDVALTLKHDGKLLLDLPAANCNKTRLSRLKKILGKEFIEQAVFLDVTQGEMRLCGWLSGQFYQRSQNDKQWLYINQRMVKDKLLNHAIKLAYDGLLEPGRYPACVLYLTIATSEVDINVHPTKHEVRFQQPRLVHDFMLSHASKAIRSGITPVDPPAEKANSLGMEIRETYVKKPMRAFDCNKRVDVTNWLVLNKKFVLIFLHEKPYLVDVERVQQQALLDRLKQHLFPLAGRPLLVPINYTIDKTKRKLIEQCQVRLVQVGIQFEWVDETTMKIRTLPIMLPQLNINKFLQGLNDSVSKIDELLKWLVECQSFDVQQLNQEHKAEIVDYLQQRLMLSGSFPWCLHLDAEKCRELVDV